MTNSSREKKNPKKPNSYYSPSLMRSQKDEYAAILEVRRWQVDFWKNCGVCRHICEPFLGSPNRRRIYRHPQLFLMGLNKAHVWKIGGRRMETLSTARMCQRGWSKSRINTIPQALQASGEFEVVALGAKAVTGELTETPQGGPGPHHLWSQRPALVMEGNHTVCM